MRVLRVLAISGLCVLFSSVAFADDIPVTNPSFEILPNSPLNSSCGSNCSFEFSSVIDGWNVMGATGLFRPGTLSGNTTYFNTLPDGPTVAFTNSGSLSQTLGVTVQPGVTYTLQVDLGNRNDAPLAGSAYLVIGGTDILATDLVPPTDGNWGTYTATFTCADTCSEVNDSIGVLLSSSSLQGNFDDVRVSDSVPEPAAISMLALGLLGLAAMGWRRRRPDLALS